MNKNNEDTPEMLNHYKTMVGAVVHKNTNKPFKSRLRYNTVKGLAKNEQTGIMGFLFEEDDSIVECWRCIEVSDTDLEK